MPYEKIDACENGCALFRLEYADLNYPGKNMNVYMQPLKDELQEAWDNGIRTYDAGTKKLPNACVVHVLDA